MNEHLQKFIELSRKLNQLKHEATKGDFNYDEIKRVLEQRFDAVKKYNSANPEKFEKEFSRNKIFYAKYPSPVRNEILRPLLGMKVPMDNMEFLIGSGFFNSEYIAKVECFGKGKNLRGAEYEWFVTRIKDGNFEGVQRLEELSGLNSNFFTIDKRCFAETGQIEKRWSQVYDKWKLFEESLKENPENPNSFFKMMYCKFAEPKMKEVQAFPEGKKKEEFVKKCISELVKSYLFNHEPNHIDDDELNPMQQEVCAYLAQLRDAPSYVVLAELSAVKNPKLIEKLAADFIFSKFAENGLDRKNLVSADLPAISSLAGKILEEYKQSL